MKVTRIKIDNFKSLVDFELNMSKFACLVGLNGSCKSTVLQCFDFLAQQCRGDIQAWLDIRHWSAADVAIEGSTSAKVFARIQTFFFAYSRLGYAFPRAASATDKILCRRIGNWRRKSFGFSP